MQYIATTGWEDGIADLTKRLIDELSSGKRVLWLLSGGSNIISSVKIMEHITTSLSKNLTVGLIDERFGPVGHDDSNWHQLALNGFIPKKATAMPVLVNNDCSLEETAVDYEHRLRFALSSHDIVIAQLGIGNDGHIAGILPGSPAATEQTKLVVSFQSETYARITTTPAAFSKFDLAYALAFGEGKRKAVQSLEAEDLSVEEQPAQLLKKVTEAYVYSDQLGEKI